MNPPTWRGFFLFQTGYQMRFRNPHSPFIRALYGEVIEALQGIFFLGYLAVSYYFFKYGDEFGLGKLLHILGVTEPKIWVWVFITFLYAVCFAFLGTLSAISSAEHSLHLLAKKLDIDEEILTQKRVHISILYYFKNISIEDGEIEFDAKLGAYRSHSTIGFMAINGMLPQRRKIGNFWGLLGRKKIDSFQFSKKAFVNFIEPTDVSKLEKNIHDTTNLWISPTADGFVKAHLEILVDGRFMRSLKKLFPDQISNGKDEKRYATIHLSATCILDGQDMNNICVSSLGVWDWARYTPQELQEHFSKDKDISDAMKTKIQNAIVQSNLA